MRALAVIVVLARVAHAGDPEPPFPMERTRAPAAGRLDEIRFVPELGQVWRFGPYFALYDGVAWWHASAAIVGGDSTGKTMEVGGEQVRLDVVVRDGHVAIEVTATARRRLCHRGDDMALPAGSRCTEWAPATNRLVCWREDVPRCTLAFTQ